MLQLDLDRFNEWITIPPEELPARSPVPLTILPDRQALLDRFAQEMFAELAGAAARGEELSVIVPIGPKGHYPELARMVNEARLSLEHATFFGMDEWLDWQGRPVPWEHPCRLEAWFRRGFLDLVEERLRPRPENVVWPSPFELDRPAEEIARRGGVATTYAGVGFQGHVAFNESPGSRWSPVTLEQLRDSTTRIAPVAVDTIIAHAQRSLGGNVFAIPPMAVTLGMRELLGARRVRLYVDGGPWKQTILRILLFAEPTVDYPVTLVKEHPDVQVVADAESAACPGREW